MAWLSQICRQGLDNDIDVLAEHENELVQLALAPCERTCDPSAEGCMQGLVCLCDDKGEHISIVNNGYNKERRELTSSISSMVLDLNADML